MSESVWYYMAGQQQVGPVHFEDIKVRAAEGTITPESYLWREGYPNWVKAWQIEGLFPGHIPPSGTYTAPIADYAEGEVSYHSVFPSVVSGAGFWKRFAAYLLDGLIMFVPQFILGFVMGEVLIVRGGMSENEVNPLAQLISAVLGWLYFALMESSSYQGTLGKLALGIKVTDVYGRRIGFDRATGRHFAKIISAVILLIGFIMAGFTAKKQALHDMIAGCLVVNR